MAGRDEFGNPRGNARASFGSHRQNESTALFSSPQDYDNNLQAISDNIRQIQNNTTQIQQLSSTIGTSRDNPDSRQKLHKLVESTKTLVKGTLSDFKLVDLKSGSTETKNRKKLLHNKLLKDFETWIERFTDLSSSAVEKERKTPLASSSSSSSSNSFQRTRPSSQQDRDRDPFEIRPQQQSDFQLQSEIDYNETIIKERDQDIRKVETAIVELHDIFQDVANLVDSQQGMIDNIESNIEDATENTTVGLTELGQAATYQKKSRTKMCCLLLIFVIILAVVGGAAFFVIKR
eukprot:TRINITY_DN4586_c0_g1_i1.p1 TRINITY_DN4586_c0_g1~~TRINITY_DN4586_c0_g1_i1.p1  ORF type:complete len:291 (-),score=104.46 TRINITY_DN4586_c0_g1_i1:109-981(-)